MPSLSAMLNQLSGLPVFSSTCSHKPAALGSLVAGAAQARALSETRITATLRNFITTPRTRSSVLTSPHQHVPELPRVGRVELFREEAGTAGQRRPVSVEPFHRAEIGPLDFQEAMEVHLVGFNNALVRVLQRPDHAAEDSGSHLQPSGILVWREFARLLDRELRAIPVGILAVAV